MQDHCLLCFVYNTIFSCFIKKLLIDACKSGKLNTQSLKDFPAVLASVDNCNCVSDL